MTAMTHVRDVRRDGASGLEERGTTWSLLVVALLVLAYAFTALYRLEARFYGDDTVGAVPSRTRAVLTADIAAALPFLLALLVVGRSWLRRLGAVLVTVGLVALQLSRDLRTPLNEPVPDPPPFPPPSTSTVLMAMVVPALVALAWGIARRQGRWWPVGVIVAAGLGYLVIHQRPPLVTTADANLPFAVWAGWYIAPAVVGGVVSWLLERWEVR
jgi:hypothetical protein